MSVTQPIWFKLATIYALSMTLSAVACSSSSKGDARNLGVGGSNAAQGNSAGSGSSAGEPPVVNVTPVTPETKTPEQEACELAKVKGSTQGCEFYSVTPPGWEAVNGSCYAAVLVNTGTTPLSITVEYDATSLNVAAMARIPKGTGASMTYEPLPNGTLPAGALGMLFLARYEDDNFYDDVDCPSGVVPGIALDPAVKDTGRGRAFHIKTSAPVAAYDIFPYGAVIGQIESATLLVPVAAWGKNYIAADPYQPEPDFESDDCSPFLQLVAAEDNTTVTIRPTSEISAGPGVSAAMPGQPQAYQLAKGEVLQFLRWGAKGRLAGSPILADKPISVWGGAPGRYSAHGPGILNQCPSSHQQFIPVNALGSEYVAVRHRDRYPQVEETVPWTIIGAVDNTELTYDPAPPQGAPTHLMSGQEAIFKTKEAFSVRSSDAEHPFYVAGHMTPFHNITQEPKPKDAGEPEFVNLIAPAQWQTSYKFLTDPTYRNAHLIFVRKQDSAGNFKEVALECLGNVSGWQPVGNAGKYEFARVDIMTNGAPNGSCGNGAQSATSEAPFTITVWGWDNEVSYAYPAGGGVRPINTAVAEPDPK
jgi:hypothetical protein